MHREGMEREERQPSLKIPLAWDLEAVDRKNCAQGLPSRKRPVQLKNVKTHPNRSLSICSLSILASLEFSTPTSQVKILLKWLTLLT